MNTKKKPRFEVNCAFCNTKIFLRPHRIKKRNFCSMNCVNKYRSKYLIGELALRYNKNAKCHQIKHQERICKICNTEFNNYRGLSTHLRFCKIKKDKRTLCNCAHCGKQFIILKTKIKKANFCSKKCFYIYIKVPENRKKYNYKIATELSRIGKNYCQCGRLKCKNAKLCSYCVPHINHFKILKGKNNHNYKKDKKHTGTCLICNKEFNIKTFTIPNKYCSHKCNSIAQRTAIAGEKNYRWNPDKKRDYDDGFNKYIKELCRHLYNYQCQICGINENKLYKRSKNNIISKYKLAIHHIDYDKTNSNLYNLIPLCIKCHHLTNNPYQKQYWMQYLQKKMNEVN